MAWSRNRRTRYVFRTKSSQRIGNYLEEVLWLKDHGYVFFSQNITPEGYINETWVDREGNVVHFKVDRPSNVGMEQATIVSSRYVPAGER